MDDAAASANLPQAPGRIVVVDDDPGIRDVVHDFLSRHGYEVETAADAVGLNRALARGPVDLVVLDVMLPGEDGLAVCKRLAATDGPAVAMLSPQRPSFFFVVASHNSSDKLQRTLEHLLVHVEPSHVVVADNGSHRSGRRQPRVGGGGAAATWSMPSPAS